MVNVQGPGLSSVEGMKLARELLCPQLDHEIHDYVLEGVCQALDGKHILAVAPTSGGKTSYYYGYILLLKALQQVDPPSPFLKRTYPANPVMVVVFPTKGLQEEMVRLQTHTPLHRVNHIHSMHDSINLESRLLPSTKTHLL